MHYTAFVPYSVTAGCSFTSQHSRSTACALLSDHVYLLIQASAAIVLAGETLPMDQMVSERALRPLQTSGADDGASTRQSNTGPSMLTGR